MPIKSPKKPLPVPWDRVLAYNVALVCDITNPPAMRDYFAVFMATGDTKVIMFPMSRN